MVNYTVALSMEEQENLKRLVPASPMIKRKNDGYTQLEDIASDEEQDVKTRNPLAFALNKKPNLIVE